ncbi:hypothetical protein B0T26DRAFT_792835 [Lasiosphaeria miniovina]|uniref:SET domain-containing protein n=1 Tax=Lasiosphaeria miniovina TaxID=1954250 RepID=A0AA39ZTL4_9PEZI|nr:uncharacterized protein B0T26DRAFT_792835 [Lasiosphaeria miniovina]KAK0703377.1 hypothetical protein B0T26DRAFT_792835 [Lasiosphaeria miniovina]
MSVDGIQKSYQKLEALTQKNFRDHLRRYLDMYLADCPFEVNSTNRYDLGREDASITARCRMLRGSAVAYLNGSRVDISREEEGFLTSHGKDFSIVFSSRRNRNCVFLGPARFVNHDCDANAVLVPEGGGIQVTTTADIEASEEITV